MKQMCIRDRVLPQANLRVIQTNTIITEHDFKKIQSVCNELLAEKKRRIFHDKLISFIDVYKRQMFVPSTILMIASGRSPIR